LLVPELDLGNQQTGKASRIQANLSRIFNPLTAVPFPQSHCHIPSGFPGRFWSTRCPRLYRGGGFHLQRRHGTQPYCV